MMVPRARLLVAVAVLGLPVGTLAAFVPEALGVSLGLVALCLLAAAIDMALGMETLADVRVSAPQVVHLSDGRAGELAIDLRGERAGARRLRAGIAVPRVLTLEEDEVATTLPPAGEGARLRFGCLATRRGVYRAGPLALATVSPLGLFEVRRLVAIDTELRVYPTLLRERRALAALFLDRGPFGIHAVRQVGKGREFEKLREYVAGDPMEDVHWKATARRGRPMTKLFQIERTQEVYVLLDASRLSGREAAPGSRSSSGSEAGLPSVPAPASRSVSGSRAREAGSRGEAETPAGSAAGAAAAEGSATVLDRFVTAALVLSLAAERQGDRFGLIAFSDRIESFARAQSGRAQHRATREALLKLEPRLSPPDFEELFTFVRLRLRRRALLLVLTSLDDPALAEGFARAVQIVSRQHLVLVNPVRPGGARPLFESADVRTTGDVYRRLGGHLVWSELRELMARLGQNGIGSTLLESNAMSGPLLEQYLRVKRRQLL